MATPTVKFEKEIKELNTLYAELEIMILGQDKLWSRINEIQQNIEFERKMES